MAEINILPTQNGELALKHNCRISIFEERKGWEIGGILLDSLAICNAQ